MEAKIEFLKTKFIPLLQTIPPNTKGQWGVLSLQQMIEHMGDAFKNAAGKLILPPLTSGETLEKMRAFLMSEKPFKENTQNPYMDAKGAPTRQPNVTAAISRLEKSIADFFNHFAANPNATTSNAFFGELTFEQNVQLLYKHALHHLKQFGVVV
ncbi:MAG: hypothetical protein ACK4HE_02025 [Chitinophagaceae bacterium]